MKPVSILIVLAGAATPAFAEVSTSFPPGAEPIAAEALSAHLAGRVFRVERPDGNHWRLQFQDNSYYFVNTERGWAGSGTWAVEEARLCTQLRGAERTCNDARLSDGRLLLRRTNGEVIALVPR